MGGNDTEIVLYGFADIDELVGQQQEMRNIIREIVALTRQKLALFTGAGTDKPVTIRSGVGDGKFYFYIVNSKPRPVTAQVILKGSAPIIELASGAEVKSQQALGRTAVSIELCPYGMKSFTSLDASLEVAAWQAG